MSVTSIEDYIQTLAYNLGFDGCGFARADFMNDDSARVEAWLAEGCNAGMSYMERNREKRYDPRVLAPGTESVVAVIQNYYPEQIISQEDNYKIAKYSYGADYHNVVKDKLRLMLKMIEERAGSMPTARVFCDSAPVLDRAWAVRCGLGFIGKNNSLIVPKKGSFFFIGIMLLPIGLMPTKVTAGTCGTCTRCVDACPAKALTPFHLDARKCLSYLTIEHNGSIETDLHGNVFGCDACQDVCPYNRFATPTTEKRFAPSADLMSMCKSDWENLDKSTFDRIFSESAFERAGFDNLKRNIGQNKTE